MTLKGVLKSFAKALLYFAIYFGWQIIVMNWASIAATVYIQSTTSGLAGMDPNQLMNEMYNRVFDIIMKYSMELTLISGILTLVTFFVIFKARKKDPFREAGLTKLELPKIPVLIALGASLNVFITMAMSLIPFPAEWIDSYIESSEMLTGGGIIAMITTIIAAPLVEEITFRGVIYSRLKGGMPMFAAMLLSSWVFGMMHGEVIWVIYAALLGLLLAWVFEKYRSLTASIIVHFAFNLFGMLSELLGDIGGFTYYSLLISSGIASSALIIYIIKKSEYKIEFNFKNATEESNG